ncbi:HAD-IIB family hydrolase, partial [Candidatus Parcubacteria bacterium]|nr:HAD-IIB family hydrolase [Candidatus Parcubacteria bacterium]
MKLKPKLVAFDLDGTITPSKSYMSREMGRRLFELLDVVPVAIMSGGTWEQFEKQLLPELPKRAKLSRLYLFPVSAGQCRVWKNKQWEIFYDHTFTQRERAEVMAALNEALVETGLAELPEQVWGERIEDRGPQITFSGLGQQAPVDAKRTWDPFKKKRAPLVAALMRRLKGYSIRPNAYSSVDITREGITKAYGLQKLSEMTGIPVKEMLYVGDGLFPGGNDEAVVPTGVATYPVSGVEEVAGVIDEIVESHGNVCERVESALGEKVRGDVHLDEVTRRQFSRDTSIFERVPTAVVFPKDKDDVSALVKAVREARKCGEHVSVTARSAGTDMTGGPLTRSIVTVFTKYMNKVEMRDGYAYAEPGAYYRDFEKETLAKGLILPSYPASKSIAAMGGIVANNAGGERTLEYGKTARYVEEMDVVLSDGSQVTFAPLGPDELEAKKAQRDFEGEIYRRVSDLILDNRERIEAARPRVSKNSAGYALWDVFDVDNGTFNLAKLITGSQGTLAFMTRMKLRLIKPQPHRAMLTVFLYDLKELPEIVKRVLKSNPESFESYDDHTFSLAVRFLPHMLFQMGFLKAFRLGVSFIPEMLMVLGGGVPKLVLMAEFSEDTAEEALAKAHEAQASLADLRLATSIKKNEKAAEKYWVVRRESFTLLRKNLSGLYASPFIDDFVVPPESYAEFLPRLNALLGEYDLVYTIAGHVGNGNFHIIPLMDLSSEKAHHTILELSPKVYDLVLSYGGSTTGEHNDGIIRTPYLPQMFGSDMVRLFTE